LLLPFWEIWRGGAKVELNATILLQLAAFLFLLSFLSKMLFEPFLRLFEEREKRIEGAQKSAGQYESMVEEKAKLIDDRLTAAQRDARATLVKLKEEGQKTQTKLVEQAREEAASRVEDARAELFAATEDARSSLNAEAEAMAELIAQKVLGRAA
jgi:F-type H+-transporting ATPase subunit b